MAPNEWHIDYDGINTNNNSYIRDEFIELVSASLAGLDINSRKATKCKKTDLLEKVELF